MHRLVALLILVLGSQGCGPEDLILTPSPPALLPSGYRCPVWGPGDLIVFRYNLVSLDLSGLWLTQADGTSQRPFLPHSTYGFYTSPDWSPDGQWLALAKDGQIYKVRVTGDELTQLTSGRGSRYSPSWGPDGQWVAFASKTHPDRIGKILAVAADGHDVKQIKNVTSFSLDWSPSGKIVFVGLPGGPQQQKLMIMEDTGENMRFVFDPARLDDYNIEHPRFSPDGTKIAFSTYPTKEKDSGIWVVNADGSRRRSLADGATEPSWSPDGRWIVYVKFSYRHPSQRSNDTLWIMDANGDKKRQLTH